MYRKEPACGLGSFTAFLDLELARARSRARSGSVTPERSRAQAFEFSFSLARKSDRKKSVSVSSLPNRFPPSLCPVALRRIPTAIHQFGIRYSKQPRF